ncbi:Acyl transferase/acyl hydrolase/lysophospholipase [Penicillium hispanicum]|uniref:Acyl transferase/acyl hydrolase/lysophospholipase n=1 Tax=Penicillium hispanicum TaxID=1080232 RepID=UPI002540C735|nr:Acyl transferase/acyl hydrolase/lysophospholipase [Penicillium hispanicum]KAJ5579502.1 Acyl transferase/acyl hydrolase/lysophospholipase [Penicillium hispanicum]
MKLQRGTTLATNAKARGFFLNEDPSRFDAPFFSITAKEAAGMNPAQRLLLEVAYEASKTAASQSILSPGVTLRLSVLGDCGMALVTGASLILYPNFTQRLSSMHMMSPDGISRSFDEAANGYGRGKGIGAVLLKPFTAALADGDNIRAVANLIRSTYDANGLSMGETAYFEAHGTGTPVGDPTELSAIGMTLDGDQAPRVVMFSSFDQAGIDHIAKDWGDFVREKKKTHDCILMRDLAHTMLTRRSHLGFRSFVVAGPLDDLHHVLETGLPKFSRVGHCPGGPFENLSCGIFGRLSVADRCHASCMVSWNLLATEASRGEQRGYAGDWDFCTGCARISRRAPPKSVVVACMNSPASTTLSGDVEQINQLEAKLQQDGYFARKLRVDTAYHSPHMEELVEAVTNAIACIKPEDQHGVSIVMLSSVTKKRVTPSELGVAYWVRNMVSPVEFTAAVSQLASLSESSKARRRTIPVRWTTFLEIGPEQRSP